MTLSSFTLAACAEMIWRDRPIEWRASRLNEMGFQVGLWNWPDHDLSKLEKSGATFSIMNGYLRGRLTDEATRFAARVVTARDGAVIDGRELSLTVDPLGYGFEERRRGAWRPLRQRALARAEWSQGTRVAIGRDSRRTIIFDTTGLASEAAIVMLRRDGEQFIQTLKTRGQSVAGLSERNEWDWYLDKARLDPKKLTDDCWPASLAELWTFFPDPWRKTKHHKRRLVNPVNAALASSRLVPGGAWRLATDWADYAEQMREVLDAEPTLEGGPVERWAERPVTRFERKGLDVGREIVDFCYRRTT